MKIGIITMHRVQNIGSVLQAYALQHKITQLGYEAELIDYIFPPQNKTFSFSSLLGETWNAIQGFPKQKTIKKLDTFRRKYLRCSPISYTKEGINKNPPEYDVYCTGSDQVWNPKHIDDDTTFMFDFAPADKPRISFASSFASDVIPQNLKQKFSNHLSKYQTITVREQSGVGIVQELTGKEASVVCDPTLLLDEQEWRSVSSNSNKLPNNGYVLVYLLRYMYDPRPGFYQIVENVRQLLKLPVYYFGGGFSEMRQPHSTVLTGLGPEEFVDLFKNAAFVITDSFHGSAFATIFNVPMLGIVKDVNAGDGRIATLRKKVGGEASIIQYNHPFTLDLNQIDHYKCNSKLVEQFRSNSLLTLKSMIEQFG